MINDFHTLVGWLKERLKSPLPGAEAHKLMMPDRVNGGKITLKPGKNPRSGSVLILLYPKDDGIYLPLMQRPEYNGVHSGQISFPGGKREPEDRDLIETAIREGEEEIGILGSDVNLLGNLSDHFITASNFEVLPVVGWMDYTPTFIPDRFEVQKVLEVEINHLLSEKTVKSKELLVRNQYRIFTPYFDVDGHVVWGATAMILSEFLTIIKTGFLKQ